MHGPLASLDIKSRLSACRVRWLLGTATAGLLGFAQSAHAAPDPQTCTGSGTTKTCTFQGNQSSGISTSNTSTGVAILKVQNLSTDILGSIVLDRTLLHSMTTLDIDTGNYAILGSQGINVTTNPFSAQIPQSTENSKNGFPGLGLTLNFAGHLAPTFVNNVAAPQYAILLNEDGTNGFSFDCGSTGCAKVGGQGGAGANFDMFASGEISTAFYGVDMSSAGGRGGNGSKSSLNSAAGGNGGSGGAGGQQRFYTSGNLTIDTYSTGLTLTSLGTQGGLGGSGTTGGQGGNGGVGGLVGLDVGLGHTMTVSGVQLGSYGGSGGNGGDNVSKQGLRGGNGAAGGRIDVIADGTLWIEVDDEAGVNYSPFAGLALSSGGGLGARGGLGDGNTAASNAGAGGNGGYITIELNNATSQALHIETLGLGQGGIVAYSAGASGASMYGIIGGSAAGGAGGSGGGVNLNGGASAVYISTAGDYSRGVTLSSQGASGGKGSDGTFWVPTPGAGGSAGRGGSIGLSLGEALAPGSTLTSQITTRGTDSAAIFVESIGGGKGGDAGDPSAFGKLVSAGSSGDGGSVQVTLGSSVNLETHGMDSPGIAALSVGGSGGSGGNTQALFGTGGSGSIGGIGGFVYVINAASIDTYGIASAGIRAQSLGGSGGNGGSATGGFTDLGGDAGSGGSGGTVHVVNTGTIYTHAAEGVDSTYINAPCVIGCSYGIFAQSVGGNGGMAGDAKAFSVTLGGGGGGTSNGGLLTVDHSGNITTVQQSSAGIFAQSLGGSGGVAGASTAGGTLFAVAIGGDGGGGGAGGQVDVNLLNKATTITTTGEGSEGIKAASIGGGGGSSNTTTATTVSAIFGISVGLGGNGAAGGAGGPVTISADIDAASAAAGVTSVPVTIITYGDSSPGVDASSIGGGGGDSSYTGAVAITGGEESLSVSVALGGSGGAGGAGGAVTVDFTNASLDIQTLGAYSYGIHAASTSDGGGASGVTATLAAGYGALPINVGVSIGGSGGSGANSGAVTINTPAGGNIGTKGDTSYGIYASSISGGGGDGGMTFSAATGTAAGSAISAPIAVGACATVDAKSCLAFSGDSGVVTVTNLSNVTTAGVRADGILASSKSGGGGNAGAVVTADLTAVVGGATGGSADVSVGGNGGTSGKAGDVTVTNAGTIITTGPQAVGIYAESISGGGGSGSSAQNFSGSVNSIPISVDVGGTGGTSGKAGNVTVTNHGEIFTGILGAEDWLTVYNADGTLSSSDIRQNEYGIFAQSLGGGGGEGGSTTSFDASLQTSKYAAFSAQVSLGGSGGTGGAGGTTTVTNDGTITTYAQSSDAIRALSYGGGGGTGGASINTLLAVGVAVPSFRTSLTIGGGGGSGATGGNVIVTNEGTLTTSGDNSRGVFAESIGGGGGDAGVTGNVTYGFQEAASAVILAVQVGGNGGTGNHGGAVTVNNSGTVSTGVSGSGTGSAGLYARSIGGGGGSGGSTGAAPSWDQTWEALGVSVTDVLDVLSAVTTFRYYGFGGTQSVATALTVNVGGRAGAAGDGGLVKVTLDGGVIKTYGFQSNGVEAYSIGGGGGDGGSGSGGLTTLASVGGDGGAAGKGGDVTVTSATSSSIETFNDSSHGIFAQSVGGGGGQAGDAPLSGVLDSFNTFMNYALSAVGIAEYNTDWASQGFGFGFSVPGAAGGGGKGGTVTIDVLTDITTRGYKSYGIFAQSVGGGGGTVGLSALSVMDLIYAASVVQNSCDCSLDNVPFGPTEAAGTYNGSTYGYGSGGYIEITSKAAITTTGAYAHGIYAQSAGGYTEPDGEFYDGLGFPSVGGDIKILSYSDVSVSGEGSIAILAQSIGGNGNGNIDITTQGVISGGSGLDAAGVKLLDGRKNTLTNWGTITCGSTSASTCVAIRSDNSTDVVTIQNTNSGGLCSGLPCPTGGTPDVVPLTLTPELTNSFELFNYGQIIGDILLGTVKDKNRVTNWGTISGQVDLGPSCTTTGKADSFCYFDNYGTWNPSVSSAVSTSSVGFNSLNNFGTINITGATTIEGALKNQTSGNLRLTLDPNIHFDQHLLTVTGLAQLDGSITPVISNLRKGEFKLLQAGTLAGTPQIADALLFNWQFSQKAGGILGLSARADFQPATIELTPNHRRLADYLTAAWDNGELALSGHFARLLAIKSGDVYRSSLDAFAGAPLLHQQTATLQALPTLLSDTLECPTGGARSIVSEGSCLWIKGGHKWGRYSGGDTNGTDIGSDFYGFGGQKEVQPDWFLSFAVGRLESGSMADGYSSSGNTTVASIGLKYQSGPWKLGAAVAMASGSYKSVRHYTMPTIAGGGLIFSGSEFDLRSQSDLNIGSLRLHASREFALDRFYVRPVLDIDLTETRRPDFEEQGPAGIFTLKVAGKSKSNYAVTPHVQIGGVVPLGEESHLRMYLDLGVRLTPDANLEIDYALQGVSERSGFARQVIDVPLVTRVLKAGAQFFRKKGLELGLEYELLDNGDLRSHSAAAKLGWQF